MGNPSLDIQLKTLPNAPGVYQYYDVDGTIIYVGKAKNLNKRVSSYFTKTHENGKTRVLVKKIASIKQIRRAVFFFCATPTRTILFKTYRRK